MKEWLKSDIDRACHIDRTPLVDLGFNVNTDDDLETFILSEDNEKIVCDWEAQSEGSRSQRYRLNAWQLLLPSIKRARDMSPEAEIETARRIMRFAHNWTQKYTYDPADPLGGELLNNFAWYDMSTGLRAAMIGYLLARSGCEQGFSDEHMQSLLKLAQEHCDYLMRKDLWSSHSNHGYYQSLGLFAMVAQAPFVFEDPGHIREVAIERTAQYLRGAVSDDGIHLEHSPLYHNFIFRSVVEVAPWLDTSQALEAEIAAMYEKMQRGMAAYYMPNGLMVPLGDSRLAHYKVELSGLKSRVKSFDADLQAVFKRDKIERYSQSFYSKDTGLIIDKRWNGFNDSYFCLTAQFHSAVHKQVDDMSVFWAEDGMPILSDPARYGYEGQTRTGSELRNRGYLYSDPKRIFVESAHAHNVVEIDGISDDRRMTPKYQSAVLATLSDEKTLAVVCERLREQLVGHSRTTIYRHGDFVLIVDYMSSLVKQDHQYTQWLQFFPSWRLAPEPEMKNAYRATFEENWCEIYCETLDKTTRRRVRGIDKRMPEPDYEIGVTSVSTVPLGPKTYFGHEEPRLMGWTSVAPLALRPAPALALHTAGSQRDAVIVTLLTKLSPGTAVPAVELVSVGEDEIIIRVTKDDVRLWSIERRDEDIAIRETGADSDVALTELSGQADPVLRLRQTHNLISARAHIENGSPVETVFDFFNEACAPVWAPAALEAAKFAEAQNDPASQRHFLQMAADAGDGESAIALGRSLLKEAETKDDYVEVEALLQQGVQARIRGAYAYLGKIYQDTGPFHDLAKAEDSFRKGALMGHPGCGASLGGMLVADGRHQEALPWLEEAAASGNAGAAFELGGLYAKGDVIEADLSKSLEFYRIAAKAGSRNAFFHAAEILLDTKSGLTDLEEGEAYMRQAAELGVTNAYHRVGTLALRKGDFKDALRHIRLGSEAGSKASLKLQKELRKMLG